ncbi:MV membrane protein [Cotia virus SPAn232]|uniref:MV membrane protein n=2 Tax=Cotia virus TaxID=39444 RepID=H6TA38_9POXV|nr:MV membrane protein [Cotia virus SPAn232]ADT91078.1 MV membrane protein [Cotia virus SPAn232]AIT70677.1 MV membrane protein [Cotia virus]
MDKSWKEILKIITITVLAILMFICGAFILYKRISNKNFIFYNLTIVGRVLMFIDYLSVIIFVPGTIILYWEYIKKVIECK